MTPKTWEVIRTRHCHHVDREVALEAQLVHPADFMPDQTGVSFPSLLAGHLLQPGRTSKLPLGWHQPYYRSLFRILLSERSH